MSKTTKISEAGIELLMCSALASEMLGIGQLLVLPEPASSTHRQTPSDPQVSRQWCIAGVVPDLMGAVATTDRMKHAVPVLRKSASASYLVFAQSVGGWQHRAVLPLVGEAVRHLLLSARTQPLQFALLCGQRRLTFEYDGRQALTQLLPHVTVVREHPATDSALVEDILRVATTALLPWSFPQLGQQTPLTCVSCICPPTLLASIEGELLRRLQ